MSVSMGQYLFLPSLSQSSLLSFSHPFVIQHYTQLSPGRGHVDMPLFMVARCSKEKEGQGLGQSVGMKENEGKELVPQSWGHSRLLCQSKFMRTRLAMVNQWVIRVQ